LCFVLIGWSCARAHLMMKEEMVMMALGKRRGKLCGFTKTQDNTLLPAINTHP